MRFLPYRLIKSGTLKQLRVVIDQKESEIKSATDFIKAIEQGNLDSVISLVDSSENAQTGELSSSLLSMRDHLKDVAEKERERKWTTEGLAKFVEILRAGNHDMHALSEIIISSLVKYMQANQGGLFIVNDENEQEPYLELTACYAYGRKKFLEKKIALGEGLVGQAYLEKDTLYLTDIPNNYVRITSGLGEALPKNILIVPLKLNEKVFGVVEIASFQLIKKYQIEFVEKLGESIASTISSVPNICAPRKKKCARTWKNYRPRRRKCSAC
jgi:GAF domain-containing protein